MSQDHTEIAVIGAGIVGLSVAYHLAVKHGRTRVVVLDEAQPMTLTSAQSGENYRNWWPHPVMTALTDHSITVMEDLARRSANRFNMNRRGYLLATRETKPDALLEQLHFGYGEPAARSIRVHDTQVSPSYKPPLTADWETAPDGVDVLANRELIHTHYPDLAPDIATILHIRRAGDISGQQLGQLMLEEMREAGGRFVEARVAAITQSSANSSFALEIEQAGARRTLRADRIVNAAGPFAPAIAHMLGETLPVTNVRQQKIAFPDRHGAVSRPMPFAIDLDGQTLAWTDEERETLATDPTLAPLLAPMPGGIHCRPDGGDRGTWIKLGWAYNSEPSEPSRDPPLDPNFPDTVLRAASRMQPKLAAYLGKLPRDRRHYGGYYTMTPENWPLIGASRTPGVFLAAAFSGYGTMASCAAGDLCARAVVGAPIPDFAKSLSLARYDDRALMDELAALASRGVL